MRRLIRTSAEPGEPLSRRLAPLSHAPRLAFLTLLLLPLSLGPFLAGSRAAAPADQSRAQSSSPRTRERVELPELRTRSSNTYRNEDGTRTTVVALGSVNYLDPLGLWLPISTAVIPAIERPGYAWQNEANQFRLFFRQVPTSEYLRLETQDEAVALTLEDANPLAQALPEGSRLTYGGVFPGVDLRYTMLPDGLKETLVLADAAAPAHYRFRLSAPEGARLRAERRGDGSWTFSEPLGAMLFTIAAPTARDSAQEPEYPRRARHASMDVEQVGGEFLIDLTLDSAWLGDPARQFPVFLDPSITVQPDDYDAVFEGNCPSCPSEDYGELYIGSDDQSSYWSGLKFSLASLPSDAFVLDGKLDLWFGLNPACISWPGHSSCQTDHVLDVHRMTGSWSVGSTTGSIQYGGVLDSYTLPFGAPADWMFWDVTGTVADWAAGQSNFGFLLKRNPDELNRSGPRSPGRNWPLDPTIRPRLVIDYNRRPGVPTLETPIQGAALDTALPVLRATATDPENDPLDYWFQVASDSSFQTIVASSDWIATTNTFTVPPGALKDGSTYYWRVKARDGFQESAWSASRSFSIRLKKLGIRDYWPMWSHGPLAVNESNGNLVLLLPGPSYPYGTNTMSASVSYNSQASTTDQGLGARWTLDTGGDASPPTKLVDHNLLSGDQQFDAVERVSGDGSSDYYTHVAGSNTYLSTPGDGAQLTKNADSPSTWTLLDADGAIYTFATADTTTGVAPLSGIEFVDEDPGQTPLYHCYDTLTLKLTSIRNATCAGSPTRELSFVWNNVSCVGAILCVTGPDAVTWKYIGDGFGGTSGKLVRINDGSRNLVEITYSSNGSDLPIKIQNANALDPTHASPGYDGNHALTIAYDGSSRVQSVSDGPVTNQTPSTSTWSFSYYALCPTSPAATRAAHEGIALGTIRPNDGCTTLKPPRQQVEPVPKVATAFYDNLGHPIQGTDLLGDTTLAGYDTRDQLLWSEDEDGNPIDVAFADVEGNPTTNPWVATAKLSATGPDPDGTGPLARPVSRSRYDETRIGEDLLTTTGAPITDAVRSAAVEGDGRAAPDSSFGIWEGTTNLVTNGGFETNLTGWTAFQATLTRITSRFKFGTASMRVTVSSNKTSYSADVGASLSGATANRTFSGSFWVYAEGSAVGKTLTAILREQGGAAGNQETSVNRTLTAGWQRVSVTRTLAQNDRTSVHLLASRPSGATSGEHLDLDGAQIEEKAVATPYVQTNGAAASRAAARVQAPASLLTAGQGWVAARVRAGISSGSASFRLFTWGDSSSNELYLRYGSGSFRMGRAIGGNTYEAQQPATFAPGDLVTLIGAWTGGVGVNRKVKVSVNGAPFALLSDTGIPSPAASLFDLGQRGYSSQDFADSDLLWAAVGTGTLTDADAAAITAFGTETPGTWSYPTSAQVSAAWTADAAAYQKPVPSAGPRLQGLQASYYANRNLAGRPTKLQNDANVSFDWGSGGPSALPGVVDNFSVRWNGYLKVETEGDYTFATIADDGTRLTVDGTLAIDHWVDQPATRVASQPIHLVAGLHKLALEYYENQTLASVELRWSCTCGISEQVIAAASLRPAWFNQTSSVSPAGRTGFSHFPDPANARSDYTLSRPLDGTNLISSFTYDAYGRVTKKVMPKGNASRTIDANGNLQGLPDTTYATTYVYYNPGETASLPGSCGVGPPVDQAQQLKSTTPRGIATAIFVYDQAGRQVAKTNGVGTTCSTFNAEGRLTSTIAPGDPQATTYTYDPAGAQRSAGDASGTVTSEYDEQGRAKRSVDSFGAEAAFTYDSESNLTQRQAAAGPLVPGPAYTTVYAYDAQNRLTSVTDPAARRYDFFYDARGNLKATQYEHNSTFAWNDYSPVGWLTAVYNRHGSLSAPLPPSVPVDSQGSPIVDFAYAYEADGKKTQQTRTGGGLAAETEGYGYDALGRMESVKLPEGTVRRYSFDRDSNRTQITENGSTTATYTYDPFNLNSQGVDQLTSATGPSRSFAYRADGEMTSRGSDTLTWDGWGRLTGGTFTGTTVTYGFDPVGFRRQRVAGGTTTRYLHGGMFETDGTGAITLTDVDGAPGDLAHFAGPPTTGSTATYLYYNGHGDLAAEADSAGTRTNAYSYDPFGTPRQTPPANRAIERWTGRWDKKLDTTTQLVEMGARPYDPVLGRFAAVDPVDGGALNAYDYAGQDPVNVYDLDGTDFCPPHCHFRHVIRRLSRFARRGLRRGARAAASAAVAGTNFVIRHKGAVVRASAITACTALGCSTVAVTCSIVFKSCKSAAAAAVRSRRARGCALGAFAGFMAANKLERVTRVGQVALAAYGCYEGTRG